MTFSRRHTQNEILTAIDAMEARGWTINGDGTITNAKLQTKRMRYDSRARKAEPRYAVVLPGGRQVTIRRGDMLAAKFSIVAAKEQPDEAEVGLRLIQEPQTRSWPAGCARCGGYMVRSDDNEWKCLQCGRINTPPRVPSPEELRYLRREPRMTVKAIAEIEEVIEECSQQRKKGGEQ